MQKNHHTIGILWVLAQLCLSGIWGYLVLRDGEIFSHKILRFDPLVVPAAVLFFGGIALLLVGTLNLGTNLTPTPEPKRTAQLVTNGLYSRVRHPIYGGILLIIWGVTLLALFEGRWLPIVTTTFLITLFFTAKSFYEERRLIARYPEYRAYKKKTWRFLPKP